MPAARNRQHHVLPSGRCMCPERVEGRAATDASDVITIPGVGRVELVPAASHPVGTGVVYTHPIGKAAST